MYPRRSGRAALQRRVRRSQTFRSSRWLERFSLPALYAGLKARTTRTGGYTNPGTALEAACVKPRTIIQQKGSSLRRSLLFVQLALTLLRFLAWCRMVHGCRRGDRVAALVQ